MAFVDLFGASLEAKDAGPQDTAAVLDGVGHVGLYFATDTDESKEFTSKLVAYSEDHFRDTCAIVLVFLGDSADAQAALHAETPFKALPFGSTAERDALISRFGVTAESVPKLVIFDAEGEVSTADGVAKLEEDPNCEGFPWKELPTLSEDEILQKLGVCVPEPGESDLAGFFMNKKNYLPRGLVDSIDEVPGKIFSGNVQPRPYCEFDKDAALAEVKKMGFASDYHKHQKAIEKFPGPSLLLIFDPKRIHGDNFVLCTTENSYKREKARIEELRQAIVKEFEDSLRPAGVAGGAEGGDGVMSFAEETVVVRDLPKACRPWVSETMEKTHEDVALFNVSNSRPLMQVMITRPRAQFGKSYKFSESGENLRDCRPQKDPNYNLHRKELEIGIQAVKEMMCSSCQTTWNRPVNKSTQYDPDHFLSERNESGYDQVDALTEFLSAVSVGVEEALQTNETVDNFQDEFSHLKKGNSGAVSKTSTNLKEIRNFVDVTYTRGKRIEWVEWVPNSTDMLAASFCEDQPFSERVENMGKATVSTVLIWSFQDTLSPHAVLLSPWEVPVFKFYPSNERFLLGGLSSGQLAVWKLSDADLGHSMRERSSRSTRQNDEDKSSGCNTIPTISYKQVSMIDESHRKAVMSIEWLPPTIEIERRGRASSDKNSKDSPVKYFVTIAGDGQVMIWDIQVLFDSINDADFVWKPIHRAPLQRTDSGTEMGCCHILYCSDRKDEKDQKQLTNFYASTEEGELIFGDWAARAEEDRKPDYVKKMFTSSKTFRPMLSLERSPIFSDILLGVTDWAFYLWKDGVNQSIFQSAYTSTYFTRGVWSPTRASVVFLGLVSGGIDIWDFSDQSHKASLTDTGASVAISSMVFQRYGDYHTSQMLAIGDSCGHLRVHTVPKNLVRPAWREVENMQKFLDREVERVTYFDKRRKELENLKGQMEKQAQMALEKEAAETGKVEDSEKADAAAEQEYKALEAACIEQLKAGAL